jgi:hypothetical protein
VSHLALIQDSPDDALNRRLKELRHNRPQEFELAESDVKILVVIPCCTKFDILRFVRISKPEFRGFVEAGENMVDVRQKGRTLKVT